MKRKKMVWWLVGGGVVFLGGYLRVLRMLKEAVWQDEVFYWMVAAKDIKDLVMVNHWLIDHPPLYMMLEHFLRRIGIEAIEKIRWMNLLFYGGSVIGMVKLLTLLRVSKRGILLGLIGYCLHPYFVGLEWQAIPYGMAVMFFVWSMYWGMRVLREGSGWWGWLITGGLFFYTSFEAIYVMTGWFLFGVLGSWKRVINKKFIKLLRSWLVVLGMLVLEQGVIILRRGGGTMFFELNEEKLIWSYGVSKLIGDVIGNNSLIWGGVVGVVGVIIVREGLGEMLKDKYRKEKLLAIMVMSVMVVSIVITMEIINIIGQGYGGGVKHIKGYYPVVLLGWWLVVMIAEKIMTQILVVIVMVLMGIGGYKNKVWMLMKKMYLSSEQARIVRRMLWAGEVDYVLGGQWQDCQEACWVFKNYYSQCYDFKKEVRVKCEDIKAKIINADEERELRGQRLFVWQEQRSHHDLCLNNNCLW